MPIFLGPGQSENKPILRTPEVFRITWTSPAGRITHFSGRQSSLADWVATPGVAGFDMPVFAPYADISPDLNGEISRGFRTEARDVALPFLMYAKGNRALYRQMRTNLFTDMNPQNGLGINGEDLPGTLTVTEIDGSTRSLDCFYVSGLEGNLDDVGAGQTWQQAVIQFRAPSPYWQGAVKTSERITNGSGKTWFPFFPLSLIGTQALGSTTITNEGQVDAQPVFTVKGPASRILLENTTTGHTIDIDYDLDGEDTAVIDCTDDNAGALLNGTVNLIPYMSFVDRSHDLWSLKPGVNTVNLSITGVTDDTRVSFTYREQFFAAW